MFGTAAESEVLMFGCEMGPLVPVNVRLPDGLDGKRLPELAFVKEMLSSSSLSLSTAVGLRYLSFVSSRVIW